MRRLKVCLIALALLLAQRHGSAVHGMVIVVEPTQIKIGTDTVPRYLDLPNKLVVAAGQTVTLVADSTFDYIEVAGTLKCSRTADTKLSYTHFFILPGGVFDCGTQTDPVLRKVELIGRNVLLDVVRDPFQWGNGFLNFGTKTMVGVPRATWGPLAAEALTGAKQIVLGFDPLGWAAGDALELTDTVQQIPGIRPRRDPAVVASISGRNITLVQPLAFDHKAIRKPDGAVAYLPRVANLTRNIVIRSEDAAGTPSHSANVGADAHWDVRYVRFEGLGRTKNITLSSLADNKPGTNQVGRYADHHHHAMGFNSASVGNAYVGTFSGGSSSGAPKWGLAQHGTHDETITDNVAVGFAGSGFVTEDGYEVRNAFLRNFSAFILGAPTDDINAEQVLTGTGAASAGCPGCSGNGFWFRGIINRFEGNEAWNNHIGVNLFNMTQAAGMYPSQPGGEHDTVFSRFTAEPVNMDGNVGAANESTGIEFWGPKEFPQKNSRGWNNGAIQFFQAQSEMASPRFVNPSFGAQGGRSFGIHVSPAYSFHLTIEGGEILGTEYGIHGGGGNITSMTDVTMQNVIDADYTQLPLEITYTRVIHKRLAQFPIQYIVFDAKPSQGVSEWIRQRGTQLKVFANQGVAGQDFRLFHTASRGSSPAPYSTGDQYPDSWTQPEQGLTEMQSWMKYGMAYRGEAYDDTKVVPFEGLINGAAIAGAVTTLGPPRGVVTYPNSREVATVRNGVITINAMLTGDFNTADDALVVSVDGAPDTLVGPQIGTDSTPDVRVAPTSNVAQGPHEIRTWRRDTSHQKIPASLMVFNYSVGNITPPSNTVAVPNVVGSQQDAATAILVAAKLVVGVVTTAPNAAPVGQVIAQMPNAGTVVNVGSTVNLNVSSGPGAPPWTTTALVWQTQKDMQGNVVALRFCWTATACREVQLK